MRASFRVRLHLCREIFDGLSTPMPIAGMARKTYGKEFYSRKIAASRMRPFTVLESAKFARFRAFAMLRQSLAQLGIDACRCMTMARMAAGREDVYRR